MSVHGEWLGFGANVALSSYTGLYYTSVALYRSLSLSQNRLTG